MKLSKYHKKRNFKKTSEPKGKISRQFKNLYVIQKHAASHLHYDFRLELNGVLLSWAVPKGPCLDPSIKRLAIHVEDHPVEYGNFEGIIPQGEYGAGTVMLWDNGTWISKDDDTALAYQKGHLRFELKGKKLKGGWSLIRLRQNDDKSWFLIKAKDKYTKPYPLYDITTVKPKSVLSNYTIEKLTEKYNVPDKELKINSKRNLLTNKKITTVKIKVNLPKSSFPTIIHPQLATFVDTPPTGSEWLHEIKFDGYRIIAFKQGKSVRLVSRNNRDWTNHFKNIKDAISRLPYPNIILDGEVVILDEHERSNFQLLQNSIGVKGPIPFLYTIFDILFYDKYNLMELKLIERKNLLNQLLKPINDPALEYSDHIIGLGPEIFKKSCELGLEGIISKYIDSPYMQKRSKNWLKSKCLQHQEFVVGGYTPPRGSRQHFGSLCLGFFDKKGKLTYAGNVGTGFNSTSLAEIYKILQKNITKKNPFITKPPGMRSATWVRPVMVAEIEFSEWTKEGLLRTPSFKGIRTDKTARSIKKENKLPTKNIPLVKKPQLISKEIHLPIKLTNPDKILYPENHISKLDLANYYDEIQEWILPYVVNRPLTILRCPDSYKKCFYQKHVNQSTAKELFGISIKEKDKTEKTIYIKNREGLISLVQMGTLEIHPWGSRIEKVEYPDMITIDLDPAPDVNWKMIVIAAKRIKEHLQSYKLKSFVKTTGGKGLHIVIPVNPEYKWDLVKQFAHAFVQFIVKTYPNDYVSEMTKSKRAGKIFIDYMRNQRGATAVCAYSTRARPEAPISVPLDWNELTHKKEDTFYTLKTLPYRLKKLKKDPWKDFFKIKQSLRLDKL